jgi:hypothetical protein
MHTQAKTLGHTKDYLNQNQIKHQPTMAHLRLDPFHFDTNLATVPST